MSVETGCCLWTEKEGREGREGRGGALHGQELYVRKFE